MVAAGGVANTTTGRVSNMDARNTVCQFAAYAADETDYYVDRRLESMQWRSYGDE